MAKVIIIAVLIVWAAIVIAPKVYRFLRDWDILNVKKKGRKDILKNNKKKNAKK